MSIENKVASFYRQLQKVKAYAGWRMVEEESKVVQMYKDVLTENEELLLQCYKSGQMSEAQWQQHLLESPSLREKMK